MSPHVPQPFGTSQPDIDRLRWLTRRLDITLLVLAVVTVLLTTATIVLAVIDLKAAVR